MYRLIAAGCLAGALFLAVHHPLAPGPMAVGLILWAALVWRRPRAWLFCVPALLPAMNFLPWTGWVAFDEFDLLLLATAAGAWAALATRRPVAVGALPRVPMLLLALLAVAQSVALVRGLADAGGIVFDLFGGYRDSMNSLRIFKSLFFALLLFPSLRDAFSRDEARAGELLAGGVAAGLALVAATVLWERFAYPGLLDFSTIYRATAMFWEMHVGGAAVDGYLALAVPFAAWGLLEARGRRRWLGAAVLAVLTGYACLMTFSRGVYFAVPIGLAVLAWLRGRPETSGLAGGLSGRTRLAIGSSFFIASNLAFMAGGYAGAGALLGVVGAVLAANSMRKAPWWPAGLRTQGGMLVALALLIEAAAVANGGSFLMTRLMAGSQDMGDRLGHWRKGIGLLEGVGDWAFGKGLGRLPAHFSARVPSHQIPADFRLGEEGGNRYVLLSGPPTAYDLSGLFGIAQRVSVPSGADVRAEFDLRASSPAVLDVALCERHLLYETECQGGQIEVGPSSNWRHAVVPLAGDPLGGGPAPRLEVFSVAVLGAGKTVDIDNLALWAGGRQWLANGDFSSGLARWSLSGSFYFLPWHVDNLYLEVLFDQGVLGLAALAGLTAWTLWRLTFGPARRHVLAPFLVASLAGFLAVGLVSSLTDAPRAAFLFYLFLLTALIIDRADA
ncbi:MAG TPA: hypothetical protein VMB75_10840 [Rhodocyclaceae bacterium]|nr:hypothetical protein [Rhodocyclaceae bacterium]